MQSNQLNLDCNSQFVPFEVFREDLLLKRPFNFYVGLRLLKNTQWLNEMDFCFANNLDNERKRKKEKKTYTHLLTRLHISNIEHAYFINSYSKYLLLSHLS